MEFGKDVGFGELFCGINDDGEGGIAYIWDGFPVSADEFNEKMQARINTLKEQADAKNDLRAELSKADLQNSEMKERLAEAERVVREKWDAHPGFAALVLSKLKLKKCSHQKIEAFGEGFRRCSECGEVEPPYTEKRIDVVDKCGVCGTEIIGNFPAVKEAWDEECEWYVCSGCRPKHTH